MDNWIIAVAVIIGLVWVISKEAEHSPTVDRDNDIAEPGIPETKHSKHAHASSRYLKRHQYHKK